MQLMVLSKDFIETAEGLIFAVVENGLEDVKVLCFLRYIFTSSGWKKVNTDEANRILSKLYPHYLYYSSRKEAHLHAVSIDQIVKHHQPRVRLQNILATQAKGIIENDLITICDLFSNNGVNLDHVGVTGSILIEAQKQASDIDLVFYNRHCFQFARHVTQKLIQQGSFSQLNELDWQESFDRRQCHISYPEYRWHEQRKFNKALINQRKFDLSLVSETLESTDQKAYTKLNFIVIQVEVIDDSLAYDYPAQFFISNPQIDSIVSYTATYTGQAQKGDKVEVAGMLEQSSDGQKRIIVGSTREADGEYIKVINV